MAQVVYAQGALRDLERLMDFLLETHAKLAAQTAPLIVDAIRVLERHPLIGRPVEEGLRELLISRGRTGYVALYRFLEREGVIRVLAVRHQRELGYQGDEG